MPEPETASPADADNATLQTEVASPKGVLLQDRLTQGGRHLGRMLRWLRHRLSLDGLSAWLGNLIRRRDTWLVLLSIIIGAIAGLLVLTLRALAYWLQTTLYQLAPGERLSAMNFLAFNYALIPAIGGLLLGGLTLLLRRRKARYVDLVEANALHGGKLSMIDSLIITGQTLLSNGFGASQRRLRGSGHVPPPEPQYSFQILWHGQRYPAVARVSLHRCTI